MNSETLIYFDIYEIVRVYFNVLKSSSFNSTYSKIHGIQKYISAKKVSLDGEQQMEWGDYVMTRENGEELEKGNPFIWIFP